MPNADPLGIPNAAPIEGVCGTHQEHAGTATATASRIASSFLGLWTGAFDAGSWPELVELYTQHAQLFGNKPSLYTGLDAIERYFAALAPGCRVSFGNLTVAQPLPDVILVATTASFVRDKVLILRRLTLTLVLLASHWRIASHHASPTQPGTSS